MAKKIGFCLHREMSRWLRITNLKKEEILMAKRIGFCLMLGLMVVVFAGMSWAAVPYKINFQGKISPPIPGPSTSLPNIVKFTITTNKTSPSYLDVFPSNFSYDQTTGIFNCNIDLTSYPGTVNDFRWGDAEIETFINDGTGWNSVGTQPFLSVPYSFRAAVADSLASGSTVPDPLWINYLNSYQGFDNFTPYGRWALGYGIARDKTSAKWNIVQPQYFSVLWNKNESLNYYAYASADTRIAGPLNDAELESYYKGTLIDISGSANYPGNLTVGGNVGIGTTSPSAKLSIFNSSPNWNQDSKIRLATENETAYYGELGFHRGTVDDSDRGLYLSDGSGNKALFVKYNGNVGIGTTAPLSKLSVGGAGNATISICGIGSGTTGKGVYGYSPGSTTAPESSRGVQGDSDYGIGVRGASTSGWAGYFVGKSYFSSNVGIGTTSPLSGSKLDINGALHAENINSLYAGQITIHNNGDGSGLFLGGALNSLGGGSPAVTVDYTTALSVLKINNGGFPATYIGGKVGIGTTTPGATLDVNGTARIGGGPSFKTYSEEKATTGGAGYVYFTVPSAKIFFVSAVGKLDANNVWTPAPVISFNDSGSNNVYVSTGLGIPGHARIFVIYQ